MQVDYQPFVDRMINRYEGGYGWNKKDPGGPTKYGITCYDLAEHRGEPMTSMVDWAPKVQAMTLSEAEDIYRAKYAKAIAFDALPVGIDCCMMDYGVNSGYARATRVACALTKLPARTKVDPQLLDAIKALDSKAFVNAMCQERLHFMHQIRGGAAWEEFGIGWQRRVDDLNLYCIALCNKATPTAAPDLSQVPTPKATHPEAKAGKTVTTTVTTGGAAAAGAHTLGIQPWEIIAGVGVLLVAGFAYHRWQQSKVDAANAKVIIPPGIVIPKAV